MGSQLCSRLQSTTINVNAKKVRWGRCSCPMKEETDAIWHSLLMRIRQSCVDGCERFCPEIWTVYMVITWTFCDVLCCCDVLTQRSTFMPNMRREATHLRIFFVVRRNVSTAVVEAECLLVWDHHLQRRGVCRGRNNECELVSMENSMNLWVWEMGEELNLVSLLSLVLIM